MRTSFTLSLLVGLCLVMTISRAQGEADLKRTVPERVYLVAYGRHNPERDYQREYLREVWKTVEESNVVTRALQIVTSRMEDEDLDEARSAVERLRQATQSLNWEGLGDYEEWVYAQSMEFPQSHHLLLLRVAPETAVGLRDSLANLFALAEEASQGHVAVKTEPLDDASMISLSLPEQVPMRPVVIQAGGVVILATDAKLARESYDLLTGQGGASKFDDPRLQAALARLPEAEDSVVFFDGKLQMQRLGAIPAMIREQAGDDEDAQRVVELVEEVLDQVAIVDHTVSVGYTDGVRNCQEELTQFVAGAGETMLGRVLGSGQPFEDWERWVPADATAYGLNSGITLLPAYRWAMEEIEEHFPEAAGALEQFKTIQEQIGVNVESDILEAFSGESVSVTLPPLQASPLGSSDSVLAMRCAKPERVRELLHRLVGLLAQNERLAPQQIALEPSQDLEGFETLTVLMLNSFGVRPTIGFHDGWMIIGSRESAVQRVLKARSGDVDNVTQGDDFGQFGLQIDGPVVAVSYTNLANGTRQAAMFLRQIGVFVPTILAMAGAEVDEEDMAPVKEIFALLPAIANIVEKFDFLEKQLSVTQQAAEPYVYHKRSVVLVRPPTESVPVEDEAEAVGTR